MKKIITVITSIILCVAPSAIADFKIGVLAKRGAPTCMKKWGATGAYLTEKTGEKCSILPLKFIAIEPAVKSGKIDFMLANSAFYVEMQKKYGVKAIATMINSKKGKALNKFGGVLFTRNDSNIKTLADVRGQKFMCVKYSSFGGGHMVWRLLLENGIDPNKDCSAFLEGKKHDNVVLAVKNGSVDVGTVRTDTIERMQDEGKVNISDFRILNKVSDNFPFVHSTRLYPEWPMAACNNASPGIVSKVASALKNLEPDSTAAKAAKIVGWSELLDYGPVTECLKTIKYGPFKN